MCDTITIWGNKLWSQWPLILQSQSNIVKLNQNRNAAGVAVGELLVLVIVIRYHLSENANVSVYSELVTMGGWRDGPSISGLVPHHISYEFSAHVSTRVTVQVGSGGGLTPTDWLVLPVLVELVVRQCAKPGGPLWPASSPGDRAPSTPAHLL